MFNKILIFIFIIGVFILNLQVSLAHQKDNFNNQKLNKYGFYYLPIYESLNRNVWNKLTTTTSTTSTTTPKNTSLKIINDERIAAALKAEPDAEMLPAGYSGIAPPGVDHMEMNNSSDER